MDQSRNFHPVDIALFLFTLLISLGVGLYYGCFQRSKQQTTKDFLTGGGNMSAVPVAISMFMSYVSGVLVLGNTAEMYTAGVQYWLACIGSSLAFVFAAVVFVPLFFPLRFTSGNQYYEERFNSKLVRIWAAIMYVMSSVIYMGLTTYTPATALNAVTGFPIWASILCMGLVATIYTTLGGMKAVVWTDTIQGGILVAGIITVLIAGSVAVGGMSRVMQISAEGGRLRLFDFTPDPTIRLTFWSVIFGRFFISLNYVAGQTAIIRYSSLRSLKDARLTSIGRRNPTGEQVIDMWVCQWLILNYEITALLNVPAIILVYTLTCLCGLVVYAYYAAKGCDPLRNKEISSSNQLLPYFIMEVVNYPGIPGVFLAVLFSGALSSISSSLNALSACMWKDLLEWKWHDIPESRKAFISKILVAIFGGLGVAMAFVAEGLGGHVLQATQSLVGGFGGPSLGLFFLGSFFPWANWQGALIGSLTGFGMTAWVSIGAYVNRGGFSMLPTSIANCTLPNTTDTLTTLSYLTTSDMEYTSTAITPPAGDNVLAIYRMSFMYNAGWGCLITIIIGIIVSLITGPTSPSDVDPKLLVPVFDRLCCCLPMSWRVRCRCGVDYDKEERDPQLDMEEPVKNKLPPAVDEKTITNGSLKPAVNSVFDEKTNSFYNGFKNRGFESTQF